MNSIYDIADGYWQALNLSERDRTVLAWDIQQSTHLLNGAKHISGPDSRIDYAIEALREPLMGYEARARLDHDKGPKLIDYDVAVEKMREELAGGKVTGISGAPCTGKTTLLYLIAAECTGVLSVDEFWYVNDRERFEDQIALVEKAKANQQNVMVTAAQLDPLYLDRMTYLHRQPDDRKARMENRKKGIDVLRANNFELAQLIDFWLFEVQQLEADMVVDTTGR